MTGGSRWVLFDIWRGAYKFQGVKIETRDGKVPLPLFAAHSVDISLRWVDLLRGRILASVVLIEPQLNFVAGPPGKENQWGLGQDWADIVKSLVPLKIGHVEVRQGEAHFGDPYQTPPVELYLGQIEGTLANLHDQRVDSHALPSALSLTAKLMDQASLRLLLKLDAFAEKPTFDYSVILLNAKFESLNPMLNRYGGFDVGGGEISIYSEGKSEAGHFKGYVKPLIKGLKVMKANEKLSPMLIKKSLVGIFAWIFKDHFRDLDAARVPLEGDLGGPQMQWLPAFFSLLKNAFISPLSANLEQVKDLHEFKGLGNPV